MVERSKKIRMSPEATQIMFEPVNNLEKNLLLIMSLMKQNRKFLTPMRSVLLPERVMVVIMQFPQK